ncbi:hypothetical protein FIBSPDRAFT_792855, partial [Athelia psychrophila]
PPATAPSRFRHLLSQSVTPSTSTPTSPARFLRNTKSCPSTSIIAAHPAYASRGFDNFTTTIPDGNYFAGVAYSVYVDITYPVNGTTGAPYYQVAGTYGSINITSS